MSGESNWSPISQEQRIASGHGPRNFEAAGTPVELPAEGMLDYAQPVSYHDISPAAYLYADLVYIHEDQGSSPGQEPVVMAYEMQHHGQSYSATPSPNVSQSNT